MREWIFIQVATVGEFLQYQLSLVTP
uniref:Uncharacterized protein n=1 Tax=Arundo donax TaxID=35708 RepID=A0A0A8ZTV4_ARUDO